jgi:hypothetical protein
MLDLAKIVLFISACAGLFGLTLFLFRDQITSSRVASSKENYRRLGGPLSATFSRKGAPTRRST